MDNVIYSRTVSHPDKESSACICLTEETNGYALFEVIRLGGEAQEKKLLCWHFKWDRDGAIEHAVEYIHNKQQTWDATTKISFAALPPVIFPCGRGQGATMERRSPASAASR